MNKKKQMRSTGASQYDYRCCFAGLILPLKDAVQVGMDFEKQMSEVQSLLQVVQLKK
ncbi:hypothetical protein ACEQPO_14130 [Bacillus sp. SL00103]